MMKGLFIIQQAKVWIRACGVAPRLRSRVTLHRSRGENTESLSDRVEMAIVTYLQKNQKAIYLEIEDDLYPRFTGLLTPSKGLIYAILNSYAEREAGYWKLRAEDVASARREELNNICALIETIGKRLGYTTPQAG